MDQIKLKEEKNDEEKNNDEDEDEFVDESRNNISKINKTNESEEDIQFLGGDDEEPNMLKVPVSRMGNRIRDGFEIQSMSERSMYGSVVNSLMNLNGNENESQQDKAPIPKQVEANEIEFGQMKNLHELIQKMKTRLCKPEDILM